MFQIINLSNSLIFISSHKIWINFSSFWAVSGRTHANRLKKFFWCLTTNTSNFRLMAAWEWNATPPSVEGFRGLWCWKDLWLPSGELRGWVASFKEFLCLCLHTVQLLVILCHHFLKGSHWRCCGWSLCFHVARVTSFVSEFLAIITCLVCSLKFLFHALAEVPNILIHAYQLFHNWSFLWFKGFITHPLLTLLPTNMDALRFISPIESSFLFLLFFFQNRHFRCCRSWSLFAVKDHSSGIWVVLAYTLHCTECTFIQFIDLSLKLIVMANVLVHALISTFHHSFDLFQVPSGHRGLNLI